MQPRRLLAVVLTIGLTLDLLSFIEWSEPLWSTPLTALVLVGVAIVTFADPRAGAIVVLLELLWGSHGYLLRIPAGGLDLSLRTGIFFVVLAATIWHLRTSEDRALLWGAIRTHPARWPALAFLATLVLAGILGLLRHPFDRVFFDANAWGFFALAPAFLIAQIRMMRMDRADDADMRIGSNWSNVSASGGKYQVSNVVLVGALYLILRTYALLFLFSHDLGGTWMPLYQWVRDTRLGEVTIFPGAFPRVFMPSMVLLFPAVLIVGARMMRMDRTDDADTRMPLLPESGGKTSNFSPSSLEGEREGEESRTFTASVFGGGVAVLLLSLSRSYWLALIALAVIGIAWVIWSWQRKYYSPIRTNRRIVQGVAVAIGSIIAMSLLAIIVVRLPYPKSLTTAGIGSTLLARLSADAAVSNRWQQLQPLRDATWQHPILGNGFGAAVTYETKDPRTLASFPNRQYTTTAFEWGYLDDLLERGVIGLLVELWFIGALIWYGLKKQSSPPLALALLAIAVVHTASPYLNHPLGIGVVLWLFAMESP
ncbi:O-antigen ligase family protein, partial [Candidatus Uhrbacteria bacterium]|nr:O-antigen ligase family protein [Candidatus Uhrbacteria bacterium]